MPGSSPDLSQPRTLLKEQTTRAHSATHIVHWTLKHILGDHARQAGSLVAPGRLRFDFPHHSAVPLEVLEHVIGLDPAGREVGARTWDASPGPPSPRGPCRPSASPRPHPIQSAE